ncbi:LOW QUALITY PROTEIN: wolframin [Saccoglossus kowalevskii]|uniref:LOW QUALITY PROTEIN: wolframin n=1 Tax=Saccoglossus kowalevskii TaxID=10224 RepID=A0ABM0H0D3_SACKO|nr:PREDICTED: LOW QUALITY PROTEIN: wolframin [Saccoglossus kowalevskii]
MDETSDASGAEKRRLVEETAEEGGKEFDAEPQSEKREEDNRMQNVEADDGSMPTPLSKSVNDGAEQPDAPTQSVEVLGGKESPPITVLDTEQSGDNSRAITTDEGNVSNNAPPDTTTDTVGDVSTNTEDDTTENDEIDSGGGIADAAKSFFHSLLPENETVLTKESLRNAISGAAMSASKLREIRIMEKLIDKGEELSEDAFIGKAVDLAEGILPKELSNLSDIGDFDTNIDPEEYEKATAIQKVLKYPGYSMKLAASYVIDTVSNKGLSWLRNMVPTAQIQTLLLIFLYSVCTLDTILFVVPIFLQYLSFFSLIVCTLQMFQGKRKQINLKSWSQMLSDHYRALDKDQTESYFDWTTLKPYFSFLAALLSFVFSFSLVDTDWLPYSEFTIISLFLTMSSYIGLGDSEDHITLVSLCVQVVTAVQSSVVQSSSQGVMLSIANNLNNGYTISLMESLHVHLTVLTALHLIPPALFINVLLRKSWRDGLQILIPHLICVMWLQIAVTCYSQSSIYGLMRGLFGWWAMVFIAPIMVLITIVWLAIWVIKVVFITGSGLKILISLILLGVVLLLPIYLSKGLPFKLSKKAVTSALVVAGILSLFPAVYVGITQFKSGASKMSWQQYYNLCGPVTGKSTVANTQIVCDHLTGQWVTWQGNVTGVKISAVDNKAEAALNVFPATLSNWLSCVYGDPYPECNTTENATENGTNKLCEIKQISGRDCHMSKYDTLTFQISAKMKSTDGKSSVINIVASHSFRHTALSLQIGNRIEFTGTLTTNLGAPGLTLTLYSLQCLTCTSIQADLITQQQTISEQLMESLFFALNFFIPPFFSTSE